MNRYKKLAKAISERLVKNERKIEITPEEAMEIIYCLTGMSRILVIAESEHGSAEMSRCKKCGLCKT